MVCEGELLPWEIGEALSWFLEREIEPIIIEPRMSKKKKNHHYHPRPFSPRSAGGDTSALRVLREVVGRMCGCGVKK